MPKRRQEVEETIKRAIRDTKAIDPLITRDKLLETLEKKFNRTLDHRYVARLTDKVYRQVRLEADHKAVEQRLAEIRETFRIGRAKLMQIIYWTKNDESMKQPFAEEVVKAVHALVQLDLAILNAELDAGLYRKNEKEIKEELRYKPLPPEMREQIVIVYRKWGRLPEPVVQEIIGPPAVIHEHSPVTA